MQKSYDAGVASATTGGVAPQHGQRRRHNFGDRVYKLAPEETPFFAYLNAVGKYPTDDPVFRVLEDRAPLKWADRQYKFDVDAADVIKVEGTAGGNWKFSDEGSNPSDTIPVHNSGELIVGMVINAINFASEMPQQCLGKITAVGSGSIEVQSVQASGLGGGTDDIDITSAADDDIKFQVIGTAFGEGTLSPASFGYAIEDNVGYTQIFKTTAHMSNTEMATVMRGYASEWDRTWAMKLREHKVDIERAFLFSNLHRDAGNIQYTDGIIGHIIKNGTAQSTDATDLAYLSGKPYVRVVDTASNNQEATYDRFLKDFEVIFDPSRGGASQKFCMASLPVVTYLNQLKNGFMDGSANSVMRYNLNFSDAEGGLGHKVMKIDTVHGSIAVVKNPLLKGSAASMMVGVDLDNVKYRPLVGNGVNRDTYIDTNVQAPDEDSRKDLILTEAGLEICLPESHFLYNFVNGSNQLG
tara:strand:+ start:3065 stop:4468 length:1404 start_codon:yes stop_codon:yes gene_type:complete